MLNNGKDEEGTKERLSWREWSFWGPGWGLAINAVLEFHILYLSSLHGPSKPGSALRWHTLLLINNTVQPLSYIYWVQDIYIGKSTYTYYIRIMQAILHIYYTNHRLTISSCLYCSFLPWCTFLLFHTIASSGISVPVALGFLLVRAWACEPILANGTWAEVSWKHLWQIFLCNKQRYTGGNTTSSVLDMGTSACKWHLGTPTSILQL